MFQFRHIIVYPLARFTKLFCQVTERRRLGSKCESYTYSETGDPVSVLKHTSQVLPEKLEDNEILVKMLAAPINPADINMIQGLYPIKPKLPAVGGNEGVGEVMMTGQRVSGLNPGDRVIPARSGWGTWRTYTVCASGTVKKIPKELGVVEAATMAVNPCTAFRMLNDFERLAPGDSVIQNGANSGVGQAVIQIAASMGCSTINVVRKRPNLEALTQDLKKLGATHVITEEFLQSADMKNLIKSLNKPPKLAFNCVGGKGVAYLLKALDDGGTMVTYGGMSKQPLMIATSSFIFSDVKLRGFWMTKWNERNDGSTDMSDMWKKLTDLAMCGKLKPPGHRIVKFDQFLDGVARSMQPFVTEKQILVY